LNFATPLDRFDFTRSAYDTAPSGIAVSPWNAQAFDSNGVSLGTVGEGQQSFFSANPSVSFFFTGPDIAKVTFFRDSQNTFSGIAQVPLDDLILTFSDSTIPDPPIITSPTEGSTVFNPITVTGTAEPNALVELFASGGFSTTTTADSNGNWSANLLIALSGVYTLTATQTTSGGTSAVSTAITVTLSPPAPTITSPANNARLLAEPFTVTGTSFPFATIDLFRGFTILISTTTADSNGNWSANVPTLIIQLHPLTATQTENGVTSPASEILSIAVIPNPPTITIPINSATVFTNPFTVTGTADPNALVELFNGTAALGTTTADSNGDWSRQVTLLSDGIFTITATQNFNGVTSDESTTVDITLVTTSPITVNFDLVDTSGGLVSGTAVDTYLAGFGITVTDEGSITTDFTIFSHDNDARVFPTSAPNAFYRSFGNEPYSYSLNFANTLDRFDFTRSAYDTAPSGIAVSPWNAQAFDSNGVSLGTVGEGQQSFFSANPPVSFFFTGPDIAKVTFFRDSQNTFSGIAQVPLDDLILTFSDSTIPDPPIITSPIDGTTITTDTVTLTGTADANNTIEVFDGITSLGNATADANGDWTFTTGTLTDGAHTFTATASDGVNTSESSTPVNIIVTIDTTSPVQFLSKFGTFGEGDGQFDFPIGLALDSSDNIYVTDSGNNRVQIFDSSGNFLSKFGTFGEGNGQFKGPIDIVFDSSGNIYVLDSGNFRVQIFDSSGNFLSTFGTEGSGDGQFELPQAIAVDSSDNIYVTDAFSERIQIFDSSGNFLSTFGTSGSANGQFVSPLGITVDSSGNIYVVDSSNFRVQIFDSSGNFLSTFGTEGSANGQFSFPTCITVDSSGNIYVTDTENDRVQIFDSSGNFLSTFGTFGEGDGQFSIPIGIKLDLSGNIYVADVDNNRIQKFSPFNETNIAPTLSTVSISSNNFVPTLAVPDDLVTLTFTADEPITNVTVTISGGTATVTNTTGNTWAATRTMQVDDTAGIVAFTIDFENLTATAGTQVTATTDGSSVTFSSELSGGTISGIIFNDTNGNTLQDIGESGILGIVFCNRDCKS